MLPHRPRPHPLVGGATPHLLGQHGCVGEGPAPRGLLGILGPLGGNLVGRGLGLGLGLASEGRRLRLARVGGGGREVEVVEVRADSSHALHTAAGCQGCLRLVGEGGREGGGVDTTEDTQCLVVS